MAINYFSSSAVASRYARARPELNGRFNRELLRHTGKLDTAADFGCGTGLSTQPEHEFPFSGSAWLLRRTD